ncbi:WD40-repeat-containing domain protein [Hygrophoropsis aurantiaca]|uniref:WD40-repeat-containing domain protein n=1 Tax=Hygrophoropsis aurantiaca TaxID=72124 RepID=A0ACB8AQY8_9AGAM|nr:WD40-repeat-containing domain protein [Hygrophoropsis aurantiaca]
MACPSPSPIHLLRSHSALVNTLFLSHDNERIYSGDANGRVVITSTRSLRAIATWNAHTDTLLGIEEWDDSIITHGRDNQLHVWKRPPELGSIRLEGAASLPDLPTPILSYSLDVNALNYCRFSLLHFSEHEALLAVPNLVESALADVWTLPSCQRLHAAIGRPEEPITNFSDGRSGSKTGIIMSMHLFQPDGTSQPSSSSSNEQNLRILCAYENGSVILRKYTTPGKKTSVEGIGWEAIWSHKLHVESVMSMTISGDRTFALTVSADHLIGRYDLARTQNSSEDPVATAFRTKHPGNAAVAIRGDGRVCAVGGWDGRVRLFSTKSFKPLGTLVYHKQACQAIAFASTTIDSHPARSDREEDCNCDDDDGDEMTVDEKRARERWLITGGKDARVSIWELMSFEK